MEHASGGIRVPHLDAVREAVTRFQQAPTSENVGALRALRKTLIDYWLGEPPEALWVSYLGSLKVAHFALSGSGLRFLERIPQEEELASEIHRLLSGGWRRPRAANAALAGMLLCRAHELPILRDLENCPDWLLEDYLKFLLELPPVFNRIGEADQYRDFALSLVDALEPLVLADHPTPLARRVAECFLRHQNLAQTYFTEANLRPLFRKRARLLERALEFAGHTLDQAFAPALDPARRIRLGILTADLFPRAETYYDLAIFEHLDRSRFELILYTCQPTGQPLEQYARERTDRFVALSKTELASSAARIRADDLDLILIASNVTAISSPVTLLAAHRLARIQVALMTSPVTTGFRNADYLLSSAWNEPPEAAAEHYTETLCLLEGCLNCYAYHLDQAPRTVNASRAILGIPEDASVYFSGANFFKITPELSRTWARILARVPGSRLLLLPFNPNWSGSYLGKPFLDRWNAQLAAEGLDAGRLQIVNPMATRADVQAVLALADIYLDSYPFAGACSVVDALMVGRPIVTRRGRQARALHAASMLRALGLESLVAQDESDYIQRAVTLAQDAALRQRISESIAAHPRESAPFLDTRSYARRVGRALEALFHQYVARQRELLNEDPAALSSRIAARSPSSALASLDDQQIVNKLVLPYLRCLGGHLVDVGACYGQLAVPFLAEGWTADLFEPDPVARQTLACNLAPFAGRCRIFEVAAGDCAQHSAAFHRAATAGLSGFSPSRFGPTAEVLPVPVVRLGEYLAQQGVRRVDFLKIDTEGWDFRVLAGHDFTRYPPRLVMVEYSTEFPGQSLAEVNQVLAEMSRRGYEAVVFSGQDDGNFQRGLWQYRCEKILIGQPVSEEGFGNILFYPKAEKEFLAALIGLLQSS